MSSSSIYYVVYNSTSHYYSHPPIPIHPHLIHIHDLRNTYTTIPLPTHFNWKANLLLGIWGSAECGLLRAWGGWSTASGRGCRIPERTLGLGLCVGSKCLGIKWCWSRVLQSSLYLLEMNSESGKIYHIDFLKELHFQIFCLCFYQKLSYAL